MRGQRHIRHARERVIGLQWLGVEHVKAGMADMAALQRGDQRRLVHQRAARGVDEDDARLHARDARRTEEAARFVGERQMQRHHVGAR